MSMVSQGMAELGIMQASLRFKQRQAAKIIYLQAVNLKCEDGGSFVQLL
jgi:hypothetical protein